MHVSARRMLAGFAAITTVMYAAAGASAPGVSNFHQVSEHLYRGAQPSPDGIKSLAKLGVKTVIDLRRPTEHSCDAEDRAVEAAGMHYVSIPMNGFSAPTEEQVRKVLDAVDNSSGPVFVHCRRGADRTGTVIACYRISHDRWANRKALQEAKDCGMSWIEIAMQRYVLSYHAPTVAAGTAVPAQAAATGTVN